MPIFCCIVGRETFRGLKVACHVFGSPFMDHIGLPQMYAMLVIFFQFSFLEKWEESADSSGQGVFHETSPHRQDTNTKDVLQRGQSVVN